jgi:hypothetical protein
VTTFLPYQDFKASAKVLDKLRLGKQRVECYQMVRVILGYTDGGWRRHPAVVMWENHPHHLIVYGMAICEEWMERGYNDTVWEKLYHLFDKGNVEHPPSWLGDTRVHDSHKSRLLQKDPGHYGQCGWNVDPNLPYFWPGPG